MAIKTGNFDRSLIFWPILANKRQWTIKHTRKQNTPLNGLKMDNMKDMIKVNGVWYVRDDGILSNIIEYSGCEYEDKNILIEASLLPGSDLMLEVTDKNNGKTDFTWDNDVFLRGVIDGNPNSLSYLDENFSETKDVIVSFLEYLEDKGWIN